MSKINKKFMLKIGYEELGLGLGDYGRIQTDGSVIVFSEEEATRLRKIWEGGKKK